MAAEPSTSSDTTVNPRRWIGLIFISLAVALIIVDSTIVNVAIPSIVDDLKVSSTGVQWIQESYTLVFAALLLVFGSLADRLGRRRLLVIGVTIFALASILAALAPSGGLLILSRVVQGVGGAMVLPTTLSLVNAEFQGRERGIAFAIWGSTIGGMVAVGPLLGGWLTTDFSWRWAFGINPAISIAIIIGALTVVRESRDRDHAGRIDGVGAVLSIVASASLVFGLVEGRTYGWWSPKEQFTVGAWSFPASLSPIPFAFGLAVVAAIAFVWWSRARAARGRTTLIALDLFTIASFRNGNIAAMIVSLGEFGIVLALPIWLQNVLGYSALQTGFILLALAIGSFVASGFAATAGQRIGALPIVRIGIAAEIVGVASLGFVISASTHWWAVVPCLFVYGFGVGLATAQLTGVVLKDVPISRSGEGSGTQSTARQIGSALGIAILGTILFGLSGSLLQTRLEDHGVPAAAATSVANAVVNSSGGAIAGLRQQQPEAAALAAESFSDATRVAAWSAAGFLVVGLLATLRLGRGESAPESGADASVRRGTSAAERV